MKVDSNVRTHVDKINKDQQMRAQQGVRFGKMVSQQGEKLHSEQITRLLGNISEAGDRLSRSRNLRDMAKFKMLVKRFMQESVKTGLKLNQSHTLNHYWEGRSLNIVKVIDENLIELAEDLLDEEKSAIDLLEKIGEIKGLLINLYT